MLYTIEWTDSTPHSIEVTLTDEALAAWAMETGELRAFMPGVGTTIPEARDIVKAMRVNTHLRAMLIGAFMARSTADHAPHQ